MDKKLGREFIDKLYDYGYIDIHEVWDKKNELNKLKPSQIENYLNNLAIHHSLPIFKHLEKNKSKVGIGVSLSKRKSFAFIHKVYHGSPAYKAGLLVGDKILEIDGVSAKERGEEDLHKAIEGQLNTEVKLLIERSIFKTTFEVNLKREKICTADKFDSPAPSPLAKFIYDNSNPFLSILVPILLFILFFYCALGISSWYHHDIYMSNWVNNYYNWEDRVNAFDWGIIPIWAVYIYIVISVEKIFYKKREVIKYFKKPLDKKLFYISIFLTVVATIIFFLSVRVQLLSRVGSSSREGFMFYLFFLTYTLPAILWGLYYVVLKESNIIYWLPKVYLKRKKEKTQVVKRREVVKQIKEAKELLELGVLTQAEYDELIKKLKPIILNN